MKRLLPFCLLAAIFSASVSAQSVNVSNNGIIGPSSNVTISATKPSGSEDANHFAAIVCQLERKSDGKYVPIRLSVSSNSQNEFYTNFSHSQPHTFPSTISIHSDSVYLEYDFDKNENEVAINIQNLDPTQTATVNCISAVVSYRD